MEKIAFIGVGVMGKSMVRNLMKKGYEVSIYTRTKSKVEDVIEEGALWHEDVASCVENQDIIMSMVGYPADVEEIYFADHGILAHAKTGAVVIDFTTSSPALARKIYEAAKEKGISALDAPVSGGDVGAQNGTLSIMVGGDEATYQQVLPILFVLGTTLNYTGTAGNGQHTKMANQIALGGAIAGVCEAMTYARANGLNIQNMLDCISSGAAGSWQMSNMAPRIQKEDFAPGFFIKHYIKDLKIAKEGADLAHVDLQIMEAVLSMYQALEDEGLGDLGTQALIKYYEEKR
ncbi:NAD(P)-dependent oxidoreductase [Beduini massiliensis]|uniref:NAD(P)-dependent oxidoreductase n=1 Tax=Beduini massiliensis TaxID=1585974 RepID=UPI00059AA530|nr:NAD(P)-dependent oxidoreductase [Beduini massiliensis]